MNRFVAVPAFAAAFVVAFIAGRVVGGMVAAPPAAAASCETFAVCYPPTEAEIEANYLELVQLKAGLDPASTLRRARQAPEVEDLPIFTWYHQVNVVAVEAAVAVLSRPLQVGPLNPRRYDGAN